MSQEPIPDRKTAPIVPPGWPGSPPFREDVERLAMWLYVVASQAPVLGEPLPDWFATEERPRVRLRHIAQTLIDSPPEWLRIGNLIPTFQDGYREAERQDQNPEPVEFINPFPEKSEAWKGFDEAAYDLTNK